jgi:hypothetical protein
VVCVLLPEEKSKDLALEELSQEAVLKLSEMMEPPLRVFASLGHQKMEVRVKIYLLSKGLD